MNGFNKSCLGLDWGFAWSFALDRSALYVSLAPIYGVKCDVLKIPVRPSRTPTPSGTPPPSTACAPPSSRRGAPRQKRLEGSVFPESYQPPSP